MSLRDRIRAAIPPEIVLHVEDGSEPTMLFPEEEQAVARAVEARRDEFVRGRACARAALRALGEDAGPIPVGSGRQPLWAPGIVGSITHTDGFVAAAVARTPRVGLGLDAEVRAELEPEVIERVLTRDEVDRISTPDDAVLLFSAKESVFKAVFPAQGRWIDFQEVVVTLLPEEFRFRACSADPGDVELGLVEAIEGFYALDERHVVTVALVSSTDPR